MRRALDLSAGATSAYPGRLLAEVGWDVVKVEPAQGDPLRLVQSRMGGGTGGAFACLNHGKRSVVVNGNLLQKLATRADVVIGDFSVEGVSTSGIPRTSIEKLAPRYVKCSLSAFGLTGPQSTWHSSELVMQAMSGMMFITGEADEPPMQLPPYAAAMTAGITAASAILAAARAARQNRDRQKSAQIRFLDMSVVEAMVSLAHVQVDNYIKTGEVARREQSVKQALRMVPASDGFIYCAPGAVSNVKMDGIAKLLGEPRLAEDRFQTAEGRMQNWDEYVSLMLPAFAEKTALMWFEEAEKHHLTFALVQTIDELFGCPQLQARQLMRPTGSTGEVRIPGSPFRSAMTNGEVRDAPAVPGAHTEVVLQEWLGEDDA
jgi:crotonobetainyl-CoA:carnitine CoA-transferase CaiB-like acyl-CoA transferase